MSINFLSESISITKSILKNSDYFNTTDTTNEKLAKSISDFVEVLCIELQETETRLKKNKTAEVSEDKPRVVKVKSSSGSKIIDEPYAKAYDDKGNQIF